LPLCRPTRTQPAREWPRGHYSSLDALSLSTGIASGRFNGFLGRRLPVPSRPIDAHVPFLNRTPHPSAILVKELDTGAFERAANGLIVSRDHQSGFFGEFSPSNGGDTYCRLSCDVLGTPPDQGSRCPYLSAC
jgi:hypothetical protein